MGRSAFAFRSEPAAARSCVRPPILVSLAHFDHLEEAVHLFNASLKVAGHPKTAELLGECFMKLGRLDAAEGMLKQAVSLGAESRAPLLLAELSILQGRPEYAKEMLEESLRRNPTYGPAMRLLARLGRF